MTDLTPTAFLFFALPGFYTLFLIRYIASYKEVQSQVQFVFYSLALTIPSYLTAAAVVGVGNIPVLIAVQSGIALAYGAVAGYVLKRVWRSRMSRHTPWFSFMLDNIGKYVVVYTTSSKRYYGWIKNSSGDDESRREIVLGDPRRLKNDGSRIRVGDTALFCEDEIARVVLVQFDPDDEPFAD